MSVIKWLMVLLWNAFVLSGCAYVVFWRGESGWWFALATLLLAKPKDGVKP